MLFKFIGFVIVLAIIIIVLTEISKKYGNLGFNSSYSFNWSPGNSNAATSTDGFYSPSMFGGSYGASQQQNDQIFFKN